MKVIIILMIILLFWCVLSYLFKIRNIVLYWTYHLWKTNKDYIFKKFKNNFKYIIGITTIIAILLGFINEELGVYGLFIIIGMVYYFVCYKVMFEDKKDKYIEKNFLKHTYKFHKDIDNGVFSISIIFLLYSIIFIVIASVVNVFLPFKIAMSIVSGDINNLLAYLCFLIFLNFLILPPVLMKFFTWKKRKRELCINIIKSSLTILYGFVVVYISLITFDINDNLKVISVILYMVLLFANSVFILVDIIDYYREKFKSSNL
ncbi:hypothetical protein [Mammaliicoccus sp. JADD-157]|uniref:hypothetical protein n=1 Tax=Mammaliicoccus sp. JADD-157 TaxID=3404818 RepID=UPI003BB552DA